MDVTGDTNSYLRAVGRLIVNFNALEHSLRGLAWILVDPRDDRAAQIVIDGLEAARLEELVKALFPHRVQREDLKRELETILQQVATVRRHRNDFGHGLWRVPNDATDLSQISVARPPTRKKEIYAAIEGSNDPAAIEAAATEAYRVGVALDKLLETVKGVLVHPDGER